MEADRTPRSQIIDLPVWNLPWLTPGLCRIIFASVMLFGAIGHLVYLHHDCPIDLVGDEAQYWDWSRALDISYYSKGPLVAYIIRGSCAIFGDTMPAVRYPAILLGVGTSIFFYLTTLRLFRSDALALGTVLLTHLAPMFIAGSVLMTIDPPFFFCWAGATYYAVRAIFEHRRFAWLIAGVFIGLGFLAKYAALLWWPAVGAYLVIEWWTQWRKKRATYDSWTDLAVTQHARADQLLMEEPPPLRHRWFLVSGFLISLCFTAPVILWNARHGWVSALHVAKQTGTRGGGLSNGNLPELIGGQIGLLGPTLAVLMGAAVVWTLNFRKHDRRARFLVTIGLFFLTLTTMVSIVAKVQQNWPAPAYFTLLILTAYFIGNRLKTFKRWKPWRGWVWATIVIGLLATPILHDASLLFSPAARFGIKPEKVDFMAKGRGWEELGVFVSARLEESRPDTFVLCDDYLQTAEMAFYVQGQPRTYYAGSYFKDAKRLTQYDMWPDRRLDQPQLIGKDAVYVGKGGELPPDIPLAFERVSSRMLAPVMVRGHEARSHKVWLCYGFKGMKRPEGKGDY